MECPDPKCHRRPFCKDSRNKGSYTYRRYQCNCGVRFSTSELITSFDNGKTGKTKKIHELITFLAKSNEEEVINYLNLLELTKKIN